MDLLSNFLNDEINNESNNETVIEKYAKKNQSNIEIEEPGTIQDLLIQMKEEFLNGLSNSNLAQLYAEMKLNKENKSISLNFKEEYDKAMEEVEKDRSKIIDYIVKNIPEERIGKTASLSPLWAVSNINGQEVIVRLQGDPFETVEDPNEYSIKLLTSLGVLDKGDMIETANLKGEFVGICDPLNPYILVKSASQIEKIRPSEIIRIYGKTDKTF